MAHGPDPALVRLCMTSELRIVFTFVLEEENTAKTAWGPQSLKCLLSDPLQKKYDHLCSEASQRWRLAGEATTPRSAGTKVGITETQKLKEGVQRPLTQTNCYLRGGLWWRYCPKEQKTAQSTELPPREGLSLPGKEALWGHVPSAGMGSPQKCPRKWAGRSRCLLSRPGFQSPSIAPSR